MIEGISSEELTDYVRRMPGPDYPGLDKLNEALAEEIRESEANKRVLVDAFEGRLRSLLPGCTVRDGFMLMSMVPSMHVTLEGEGVVLPDVVVVEALGREWTFLGLSVSNGHASWILRRTWDEMMGKPLLAGGGS